MEPERHSGSLFNQKYFEGFRRAITMDETGKMRVEFVYEGFYYTRSIPESLLHKLCFLLVPALSAAGLIWAMSFRNPMNYSKGVMFFQILLLFLLSLELVCGVVRITAKEKLTHWEYRMASLSVKEISAVSILVSVGLIAAAAVRIAEERDFALLYRGAVIYILILILQSILMTAALREKFIATESEDVLKGIDVTNELSPMDDPDSGYWR